METVTQDFAKFGSMQRKEAEELLHAWNENGLPDDFDGNDVTIAFNTHSGNVFLTNSDYQVAMMTDEGKLESWYSCPICGHEGFKEDMMHMSDDVECQTYLKEILIAC